MRLRLFLGLALLGVAAAQTAAPPKPAMKAAAMQPVMMTPPDVKWMPAPAPTGLPGEVQLAVMSGDPAKAGPFVVRLKFADGGKIPAHWHPTDEHVTVIEGTLAAGMGDAFDAAALHEFPAGSYVLLPKRMHHFAMGKGDTVVQVHGMGPFAITYVNAADDPRKK